MYSDRQIIPLFSEILASESNGDVRILSRSPEITVSAYAYLQSRNSTKNTDNVQRSPTYPL